MAVTLDVGNAGTANQGAVTSLDITAGSDIAVGALVVIGAGRFQSGGGGTLGATGGLGGWTATPSAGVTNGNYAVKLFWTFATSGLSSGNLIGSVTCSVSADLTAAALSYLGVATSGTVTASSTGTGAATAWSTGTVAGNSGDLYVAVSAGDAGASRTSTPTSPAVERIDFFGASSGGSMTVADLLSGNANDSLAGTWSGNITHGTIGVAFAAAGGGAAQMNASTFQAIPFMGVPISG